MEGGKALFKKFAGVDVFDIEIAENDPDKIVDIVAALNQRLVSTWKTSRHLNVSIERNCERMLCSMMINMVPVLL